MENASEMGIEVTLVDVTARLAECLRDLDDIGASIAAAHLSACIDALSDYPPTDSNTSRPD